MDGTDRNTAGTTCPQCRSLADAGRIFAQVWAPLRTPSSLISSANQDVNAPSAGPMRRFVATAIRYLAGLSAVVFWLCPLRTGTQVLIFVASIEVLLIWHFGLSGVDKDLTFRRPSSTNTWPRFAEDAELRFPRATRTAEKALDARSSNRETGSTEGGYGKQRHKTSLGRDTTSKVIENMVGTRRLELLTSTVSR